MWRRLLAWSGIWGVLVALPGQASANPRADFDQRITAELRAQDAAAADLFEQGNRARERNDHASAERLYGEVFAKAPQFFHAERRRCGSLLQLDRRAEALALCSDAAEKDPSAPNLSALAGVIMQKPRGEALNDGEAAEAEDLLKRAERLDDKDPYVAIMQCQLAVVRGYDQLLRSCTTRLEQLAPDEPATAWSSWVLAIAEGRYGDAEDLVERAKRNGAPPAMLASMTKATATARPWTSHAWYWGVRVLGGFVALSLLLVLAGTMLSRLTLRNAEHWTPESAERGATLRSIYRAVLVVCSALYYVSLPLVLVLVVAVAAGLVYGMFAIGMIPIKLGAIIALMVFATIAAIVKSLTFRPSDEPPGVKVDLSKEPQLRATLDEVAATIGTRPVDTVYMTPDTNLAVFERKHGERCLLVGAAVLDGMPLESFKAILAHEYGHFSNRDTAGGGFALGVRRSLLTFIIGLAEAGQATMLNPAWWFANGFYRIFLRVSQGASRLQEILADRRAAEAYGGLAFANGLKHVIACDLRFSEHVNQEVNRAVQAKEPLKGLWSPLSERGASADELDDALNRAPSPYDSHPSPHDRIRWVEKLTGSASTSEPSSVTAWDIFQNRGHLEREMTLSVYQHLAEAGVRPPPLPKTDKPTPALPF